MVVVLGVEEFTCVKDKIIVSSVLAKGLTIRQDSLYKAKAFDEKDKSRADASAT